MFGPCLVCAEKEKRIEELCSEKDKRILDLKEQIEYLRKVLNPPTPEYKVPHQVDLQEDMILDGGGKEETDPQVEPSESPEVLAERAAMLSGTY